MPNVSKPNRKQLTPEEKTEIEEAFDLFDSDRDKLLDRDEFKVALKARLDSYTITSCMISIIQIGCVSKCDQHGYESNLRKHLVTLSQKKNSQKSSNNLKINLLAGMYVVLKWGAPSRLTFRPDSEMSSIETMTIGKMHPTISHPVSRNENLFRIILNWQKK